MTNRGTRGHLPSHAPSHLQGWKESPVFLSRTSTLSYKLKGKIMSLNIFDLFDHHLSDDQTSKMLRLLF